MLINSINKIKEAIMVWLQMLLPSAFKCALRMNWNVVLAILMTLSRRLSLLSWFSRFTESEQQDKIHYLEGADPSVVDDETGKPINQNELLVKVYVRSNTDEERNIYSIRFHFFVFCSLDLLSFSSELFSICFTIASIESIVLTPGFSS